jgi:hypothetical protein
MLPSESAPIESQQRIRPGSKQQVTGNVFGFLLRNSEDIVLGIGPLESQQRIRPGSKQQVTGSVFGFLPRNSAILRRWKTSSIKISTTASVGVVRSKNKTDSSSTGTRFFFALRRALFRRWLGS